MQKSRNVTNLSIWHELTCFLPSKSTKPQNQDIVFLYKDYKFGVLALLLRRKCVNLCHMAKFMKFKDFFKFGQNHKIYYKNFGNLLVKLAFWIQSLKNTDINHHKSRENNIITYRNHNWQLFWKVDQNHILYLSELLFIYEKASHHPFCEKYMITNENYQKTYVVTAYW